MGLWRFVRQRCDYLDIARRLFYMVLIGSLCKSGEDYHFWRGYSLRER
jgi:hypothetical protein